VGCKGPENSLVPVRSYTHFTILHEVLSPCEPRPPWTWWGFRAASATSGSGESSWSRSYSASNEQFLFTKVLGACRKNGANRCTSPVVTDNELWADSRDAQKNLNLLEWCWADFSKIFNAPELARSVGWRGSDCPAAGPQLELEMFTAPRRPRILQSRPPVAPEAMKSS